MNTKFNLESLPFSLLNAQQQQQISENFTEHSFPRGKKIWSAEESNDLFLILTGKVNLKNETKRIASLQAGDWFGDVLELNGAFKATTACPTIVARWDAREWKTCASPELRQYWTQLRNRYQSPELQYSRQEYPFIFCSGERTAAACLAMVAERLQNPIELSWIRRHLKGEQPKHLEAVGDKIDLRIRDIYYREPTWARLRELEFPALIRWGNPQHWVVVYGIEGNAMLVADPHNPARICEAIPKETLDRAWNGELWQVQFVPKIENFNLSWFLPALWRYRGAFAEIVMISIFLQVLGLLSPLLTRIIFDKGINQQNVDLIGVMVVAMGIVSIFEFGLGISRQLLLDHTVRRLDLSLSANVFSELMRLPLTYFESRQLGETGARVQELEKIRQFLTNSLTVFLDSSFALLYIALMFYFSSLLTWVALGSIFCFVLLIFGSTPFVRRAWNATLNRKAKSQSSLIEAIAGIESLKAHAAESIARNRWENHFGNYIEQSFQTAKLSTLSGKTGEFINNFSAALILFLGAKLVIEQKLSFGELIAFQMAAGRAASPLLRLANFWQNFQQVLLSVDRLRDIFDTPPETEEAGIDVDELTGRIRFERVIFQYPQTQKNKSQPDLVLNGISFDIEPGQFVGVVGESGSGKSTLSKLLMRFYRPQSGSIFVDDLDLQTADIASLRQQIGVVLQENVLLDMSVADNIALGREDVEKEAIVAAAKKAQAHDFIVKLPRGYDTLVGERGGRLSGGQRQRIALARFFLSEAKILILDEATSALDARTEKQVLEHLQTFFKGRTVLMITHRFAPLKSADLILVLDKGRIVEKGTHSQLLERGGLYSALYELQRDSV